MDELRGSEGERCVVTDLRTATRNEGKVLRLDEARNKVIVEYADGTIVSVGYSFVELTEPETVSA